MLLIHFVRAASVAVRNTNAVLVLLPTLRSLMFLYFLSSFFCRLFFLVISVGDTNTDTNKEDNEECYKRRPIYPLTFWSEFEHSEFALVPGMIMAYSGFELNLLAIFFLTLRVFVQLSFKLIQLLPVIFHITWGLQGVFSIDNLAFSSLDHIFLRRRDNSSTGF